MNPDPANQLTHAVLFASKSQATNNTASSGADLKGFIGKVEVLVNIGVKTAGDNDGACTVFLQASADNTAGNASNISGASNVATTNNTTAHSTISIDPRALPAGARYLFARFTVSGTNSPAYPVSASLIGVKQVQP